MPSIKDRVLSNLEGFAEVESSRTSPRASRPEATVGPNPFIRCPIPPLNANSDTLRQFDESGRIPARRVIPLPITTVAGGNTTVTQNTIITTPSGGGGGASSGTNLASTSVTLKVPPLAAFGTFVGAVVMSRSFQLLQLIASQAIEVRMYASALSQGADVSRATDDAVPFEVSSGVVTDVVFDTAPYVWAWQNRIAANADPTVSPTIYITVVNPTAVGVTASTVTVSYLPLEA